MTIQTLREATEENLKRLAKYLDMNIDGYSKWQIARLIRWRITR